MPLSYNLTTFFDARAEICQIFRGIFGKSKISKGHSEIIWTLVLVTQSVSLSVSHNFPSHHVHRRHVEKLCKLSGLNCTAQSETRIPQSNWREGCSEYILLTLKFWNLLWSICSVAKWLERTSGHYECCSAPSPCLFPACNLCERHTLAKHKNKQ